MVAKSMKDPKRRDRFKKKRKGPTTTEEQYRSIHIGDNKGQNEWIVKRLPDRNPVGINIKESRRWLTKQRFIQAPALLPYIDQFGHDSGFNLYETKLEAPAFIGTVISTVFRRIYMRVKSKQPRQARIRQNLLLRASAYYVITKNRYFWNRLLALSRDLGKNYRTISSILHFYLSKLDATERFVHSHACLQAKWLTSRALRPRDKSILDKEYKSLLNPLGLGKDEYSKFEYDSVWHVFTNISS